MGPPGSWGQDAKPQPRFQAPCSPSVIPGSPTVPPERQRETGQARRPAPLPIVRRADSVRGAEPGGGVGASAVSKDMLVKWFQAFASEVLMDPVHELVGRQRPIRLNDRPLAVQP